MSNSSETYTVGEFIVIPRWGEIPSRVGTVRPCSQPPIRTWVTRGGMEYRQLVRIYEMALNRRLPGRPKPYDIEGMIRRIDDAFARGELKAYFEFNEMASGGLSIEPEEHEKTERGPAPQQNKEKPVDKPCDFEKIVFKCSHCPSDPDQKREIADLQFWMEGSTRKNNLKPLPKRTKRRFTEEFQVVAGHRKANADKISVELVGGPGYNCDFDHPFIDVYDRGHKESQTFEGKTKVEFDVICKKLPPLPDAYLNPFKLIQWYFFPIQQVNSYSVNIKSCGLLADKRPGFGSMQQEIRVFPIDTYKLSLSIPPVGKLAYNKSRKEASLEAESAYTRQRASVSTKDGVDTLSYADRHGGTEISSDSSMGSVDPVDHPVKSLGASFSFERNGGDVKGSAAIGEFINGLVNLQNEIQGVMNFIQNFQPSVGWKFTFDMELFKGDLSYEWGYREWKDHTVFKWWQFAINMTLFSIKLELSFGAQFSVWFAKITAQVFGNTSMEVAVSASKEASPDDPSPWSVKLKGDPKGELGIRAALGADWVKAEGKLTCGFPFEAECKCSDDNPFYVDWKMDFSGVDAVVSGHMKFRGSFEKKWTIVQPRRSWKSGRFPGGDKEQKGLPSKGGLRK